MASPKISVLTDEEVDLVHSASLNILEQVGIYAPVSELLDLFGKAGASVDHEKKIVKIPQHLVEECIRKAPREVKLCARNPKFDLNLKHGNVYFGTGSGPIYVIDMETKERRVGTIDDLASLARIIDALQNIMMTGEIITPQDVPMDLAPQYGWATILKNCSKHLEVYMGDVDHVNDAIKMASAVIGDEDELRRRPLINFFACVGQPLNFERSFLEGFIKAAQRRIPISIQSGAMAGATGPATLAGTLALSNAEILAGVTVAQIVNPGVPVIYASWARTFALGTNTISQKPH